MLHERIVGLGLCESFLTFMREVEVVYGKDQSRQIVWRR
jgi:hypothetical protein